MAKLLFLQDLEYEYLGPMYISSMLKKHGHEVLLRIGNKLSDFEQTISQYKPDFVAFSIMSGSHHWALNMATQVKKEFGIPNIFGGPHPTFFPDFVREEGVDVIVRGEGEEACLEFMNCIDKGKDFLDINNLWISRNGHVHRNEVRALDKDLDEYPFPDRELYSDLKGKIDINERNLITSRGCPWHCTFCFNDAMRELYSGKGKYIRTRDIDKVLEEAKILRDTYHTKAIYFSDDVFGLDKKWLYEFLPKFKDQVGVPFLCLVRADVICKDEKYVECLADNGCILVSFGIESGNEDIRNKMLGKKILNSQIYKAAELLHSAGIKFRTFNIIGLPGETLEDALSTVKMNMDIKTDYPWCATFMPLPGTKLTNYAMDTGCISRDFTVNDLTPSFFSKSNLINHQNIRKLENLQKFFQTAVLWPWTFKFIKHLIKLPPNRLFTLWFGFVYFLIHVQAEKRNFWQTTYFALKNYKRLLIKKG